MLAQVASLVPAATHVSVADENVGVAEDVASVQETQVEFSECSVSIDHLGVSADMAEHVALLEPAATQVLVTIEHMGLV
jgi:hypothetical protein